MNTQDINTVIAANLAAFLTAKYGRPNQHAFAVETGLKQTTIGLLLHPERRKAVRPGSKKQPSTTITQVIKVANALGIEPWALLHPKGMALAQAAQKPAAPSAVGVKDVGAR